MPVLVDTKVSATRSNTIYIVSVALQTLWHPQTLILERYFKRFKLRELKKKEVTKIFMVKHNFSLKNIFEGTGKGLKDKFLEKGFQGNVEQTSQGPSRLDVHHHPDVV